MPLHYSDSNVELWRENPLTPAVWLSQAAAEIDVMILSLPFGSDRGSRRGLSYTEWKAGFTLLAGLIPRATCKVWLVHLGVERDATLGTKPWEYAVTAATGAGWANAGILTFRRDEISWTVDPATGLADNDEIIVALHNGSLGDLADRVMALPGLCDRDIQNQDLFLRHLANRIATQYPGQVVGDPLADDGQVLAGVKEAGGQARGIEPNQGRCDAIASLLGGIG